MSSSVLFAILGFLGVVAVCGFIGWKMSR